MKRIVLWCVLCGFFLAGCGDDKIITPEEGYHNVLVSFSASPLSSSLKSSGSIEESLISKLILYGVDENNMLVQDFREEKINPSMKGIELSIPIEVTTLYAIANPTAGFESSTISTYSDLINCIGSFTVAPITPILMSGKGVINDSEANIELIRSVAKIKVEAINEFEIESVVVKNTPNQGYVFIHDTPDAPAASARVNYEAKKTSSSTNNSIIVYVAENSKLHPTELVVTGKYLDQQATYTIVLKNNDLPIDIVRNTFYTVRITALSDFECTFKIEIPEWTEIETDSHEIPDENFA